MFSSDITQAFTYGKLDVPLFCHPPPGFECPPGTVLGLNYCLYGAKQAPACFKGVSVEFMLSEGFTAVNDSQTVWIKRQGNSSSSVPGLLMTFTIVLMVLLCIVRFANGSKSVSI